MLELKEPMGEMEAPKEKAVQKSNREELSELIKGKGRYRNFLELVRRAKYNPRYVEEREQYLRFKDYSRELNRVG
ncbi:MAG: hypothetical protein ACFFKA_03635 [Candidatus Thorarchaeota archaeon]